MRAVSSKIEVEHSAADAALVRVLSRGLVLLKAFCPRNSPLTNSELSDATGLPRPTVSRITSTLMRLGYIDYLPEKTQYRLGNAALGLGFGTLSTLDVRLRARERMQRFADQEDLMVVLSVRDGMVMVCQVLCRGRGALTVRLEVGSRVALPFSAMGRAWAASLEPSVRAAVLVEIGQHYPGHDFRPEMEEASAQIRKSGFCMTISELEPDLMGAATIVNLVRAQSPYVLGVAVPAFRYPRERCESELGPKLMALRQQLEADASHPTVLPALVEEQA